MSNQIIKQPNGKYCIFSSIVDNVTHFDMSVENIIELWANEEKKKIEKAVKGIVAALEVDAKPYFQFTKSYEDMISTIKEIHGEKECEQIKSLIEL
jgi:hypothetical protein